MVMLEHSASLAMDMSPLENKVVATCDVAAPQSHTTFDMLAIDLVFYDGIRVELGGGSTTSVDHNWKHEYLIHGPSSIGKTRLIMAITNLLEFNIYDEITTMQSNSEKWSSGIAIIVVVGSM